MNYYKKTLEKLFNKIGFIYRSNGTVVIDSCATDAAHMDAPEDLKDNKRRCRIYLDNIIPDEWIGKHGQLTITLKFTETDLQEP